MTARSLAVVVVLGLGSGAVTAAPPERPGPESPIVYAAELDGIIQPASMDYMVGTIERADRAGAALLVFTLRTPGGLVDSTRAIVAKMIAARTPVAIFVAPSGARAASAGFILTMAADVAAMAPGTHIGAAHPVGGSGARLDDTTAKKAAEDVAAYVRTLAAARHRNVALANDAVLSSRAFTEQEAIGASPPLIDLIATDLGSLLAAIDGRSIARFDGARVVLHTAGARVVPIEMTLRQRVLGAIAHPDVAYLLFSLGTLGLTIELWTPGAIVPGVVGGLSLLLSAFAFQMLPVNIAGLLLMVFGLVLFALEIKVTSYGLLSAGGLASLVLGSMMVIDSPAPELQLSRGVVVAVVAGLGGIALFLVRLAIASQRAPQASGAAAMIGEAGTVLTAIAPDAAGRVATHGEIWRAVAAEPLDAGARVRVTRVDGLTLTVTPERGPTW